MIDILPIWKRRLPKKHLDCEIYMGKEKRSQCSSFVRYGQDYFRKKMKLMVFDAPQTNGSYVFRLQAAKRLVGKTDFAFVAPYFVASGNDQIKRELLKIQKHGGEGLMARHPDIIYRPGRTDRLLKIK